MNRSEQISKLAIGLCKFNAEISSISKDAKNPFFKSDYVTLDKLIIATREVMQKNGLSILQMPLSKDTGEIGIQTILMHESGEYIESEPLYMKPVKNDPQAAGSLITYLRRYSYQAILNLNTGEDDDANSSTQPTKTTKSNLTDSQVQRLYAIGNKAKVTPADVLKVCKAEYKVNRVEDLTKANYDAICKRLEDKAK